MTSRVDFWRRRVENVRLTGNNSDRFYVKSKLILIFSAWLVIVFPVSRTFSTRLSQSSEIDSTWVIFWLEIDLGPKGTLVLPEISKIMWNCAFSFIHSNLFTSDRKVFPENYVHESSAIQLREINILCTSHSVEKWDIQCYAIFLE